MLNAWCGYTVRGLTVIYGIGEITIPETAAIIATTVRSARLTPRLLKVKRQCQWYLHCDPASAN